jgi:hypothetical protein
LETRIIINLATLFIDKSDAGMKKKLALITDATCDLPKELAEQYNVVILPIPISFPEEN